MKYRWLVGDLRFPQDKQLLKERLAGRLLDECTQQYRLEAKYRMAGSPQPFTSIVLADPAWSDAMCLEKAVYKLEEEYGCPVILIGAGGKGVAKPDRSFLLEQGAFLFSDWDGGGKFTVPSANVERVIDRWQKLCRNYRSSYSVTDLKIECTLDYDHTLARDWQDFYTIVSPFMEQKPLFCLASVAANLSKEEYGKNFSFSVRGHKFLWRDHQAPKLKPRVDLVFYLEPIGPKQWQGAIVDVRVSKSSPIAVGS